MSADATDVPGATFGISRRPDVTVVVPFYNVEPYVEACMQSIASQTLTSFQAVFVDDGSTDSSRRIVEEFCARDARFSLIDQEHSGMGPARNLGIQYADADFLTFVDSDDLVASFAFELMHKTLQRSGSDMVGANAYRFDRWGVRQSWSHRRPFGVDRVATHILEFPDLALDRMVWNKMYRRDFWLANNYQFPAMRYEDYPISLTAHLDALTVDCLSTHVYYWRERDSKTSTTQLSHVIDNVVDRVVSAEMICATIDKRAPELERTIHDLLATTDVPAIANAFAASVQEDHAELLALGRRLLSLLDPAITRNRSRFDRLQFRALETGDVPQLVALARFRESGQLTGGGLASPSIRRPGMYELEFPGSKGTDAPSRAICRIVPRHVSLHSTVTAVRWEGDELIIVGTVGLRYVRLSPNATLDLEIVSGPKSVPVDVTRFSVLDLRGDFDAVGFEARVQRHVVESLPVSLRAVHFAVTLTSGRIRRRGLLRHLGAGSPTSRVGVWGSGHRWMYAQAGRDGRFEISRLQVVPTANSVVVANGSLVVTGFARKLSASGAHEQLIEFQRRSRARIRPEALVWNSATGYFRARFSLEDFLYDSLPDDPVSEMTEYMLFATDGEARRMIENAALDQTIPLWCGVRPGVRPALVATRSSHNGVAIQRRPAAPVVNRVEIDRRGERAVLFGTSPLAPNPGMLRWAANEPSDEVDMQCCDDVDQPGGWKASVSFDVLTGSFGRYGVRMHGAVSHSIRLVSVQDGEDTLVHIDPFLLSRLPTMIEHRSRRYAFSVNCQSIVFGLA